MIRRLTGVIWVVVGLFCLVWAGVISMRLANRQIPGSHPGNEMGDAPFYAIGVLIDLVVGAGACGRARRALKSGATVRRDDAYKSIAIGLFYLLPFFVGAVFPASTIIGAGLVLAGSLAVSFTGSKPPD